MLNSKKAANCSMSRQLLVGTTLTRPGEPSVLAGEVSILELGEPLSIADHNEPGVKRLACRPRFQEERIELPHPLDS